MNYDFFLRIMRVTSFNGCHDLFWRTDGDFAPLTVYALCNDLFYWGCADCEKITPENIDILEQSYKESKHHGAELFACRVRKMRPQQPFYELLSNEDVELFNACGPERIDE